MAASSSATAARVAAALLVVCVIALFLGAAEVSAVTSAGDVSVLKQLATSWSAANLNWQGDPCDNLWRGVTCNTAANPATVTQLVLPGAGLQGSLPPAIGGLTSLQGLELSRNQLVGSLPKELGQLTNLLSLSLQWCNFSGTIPSEVGSLKNLTFLGLNGNKLTGPIPGSLGLLQQITWLDLSSNGLSGSFPVSSSSGSNGIGLDNMTQAKHFHFNDNQLSGSVPAEIFSPPNLIHIIFDHNRLGPNIPPAISNAKNLQILRLDNNLFKGSIPKEIGQLRNLQNLNLENNFFSDLLPDLSNLTSLQLLDVSNNGLSQQNIPKWVASLPNLTTLNLALGNISGQIDSNIFGISQLQSLNLSQNAVSGALEFPSTSTPSLQWIDVTNNLISGFYGQPQSNGHPITGVQIMLEGNPLCSNPYVTFHDLSCGFFSILKDWFPSANESCSGSDCKNGRMLNRKTCGCSYPLELQLILTAPTLSNLTEAIALDIETQIASKMTSGSFIALDPSQVVVDQGFSTDDVRYDLHLLFFPLVGDTLSNENETEIVMVLNQRQINISYGPFQVPYPPVTASRTSTVSLSAGVIAGIVLGALALVLLVVFYAVLQKIRADKAVANHPFASWGAGGKELGEAPKLKGARWFSLAELKLATNDWSGQNEIGKGGYGKVYKGVLKSGEIVAIKRAQEGSMQGAAEFKNEIELLSRVHHRNLVGLVGFCYEGGEQALIYDFMSSGTLRDHLYGQPQALAFSWQERLDIALGSGRGIAYLHDHANPPIIHRDVKSANILLNEKQVAKVADFGLSKLAPEEGEMRVYSETVKGTMGYLDPEYYTTFKLTDRSDVYAFGVVMLEMLTARPPIGNGRPYVVREMRTAFDTRGLSGVRQLLDPALHDLPNADLDAFLKIALNCVEEASEDRESMADVVKQLESLGAHSQDDPNMSAKSKSGIEFGSPKPLGKFDDPEVYFPSPPAAGDKGTKANDPNFQYSGNTNFLRSSFRGVTSRLSPRGFAAKRPYSPLSHKDDED